MGVREIVLLGDPVLRTPASPVERFDQELEALVEDLFATMVSAEGAGLAAPQVGISKRVLVVDVRNTAGEEARVALVNPEVVDAGGEEDRDVEGCLSIPGVSEVVSRPTRVVVEGYDPSGEPLRIEAEGLYGRALQHEVDHLDGILFIDHLSPLKRRMLLKRYRKLRATEESA